MFNTEKPLPSPEEIQRKLNEFMKREFGDRVVLAATPEPERVETGSGEAPRPRPPHTFAFDYKPKELRAYLDRFVIRQEEAKKVLSIAVCDHYNHVKACERGEHLEIGRAHV